MIRELEPWPGREYADDPNQYITPDIEVVKIGDQWKIVQNEDGLPRLRVSPYYKKVLLGKESSKEASTPRTSSSSPSSSGSAPSTR